MIFLDAEIGEQNAGEDDGSGREERLRAPPQIAAETDGRPRGRAGRRRCRGGIDGRRTEAPLPFCRDNDLRHVDCGERALPHLVDALRPLRKLQIVRYQHEAECALALQLRKQIDDVGFGVFVEIARRLVGEQQRRRARDRDPALFAAGQAAGISFTALAQANAGEQIVGVRIGLLGRHGVGKQRRQSDIVRRAQVRQQARELEYETDMARAEARQFAFR